MFSLFAHGSDAVYKSHIPPGRGLKVSSPPSFTYSPNLAASATESLTTFTTLIMGGEAAIPLADGGLSQTDSKSPSQRTYLETTTRSTSSKPTYLEAQVPTTRSDATQLEPKVPISRLGAGFGARCGPNCNHDDHYKTYRPKNQFSSDESGKVSVEDSFLQPTSSYQIDDTHNGHSKPMRRKQIRPSSFHPSSFNKTSNGRPGNTSTGASFNLAESQDEAQSFIKSLVDSAPKMTVSSVTCEACKGDSNFDDRFYIRVDLEPISYSPRGLDV